MDFYLNYLLLSVLKKYCNPTYFQECLIYENLNLKFECSYLSNVRIYFEIIKNIMVTIKFKNIFLNNNCIFMIKSKALNMFK